MLTALPVLVMVPLLVGAASLVSQRWGARVGGLISTLPAVVGPVLLIGAESQGAGFAARAANGTLIGLVSLSAFAVVYGRVARHARWGTSLAAGWVVAGMVAVAVGDLAGGWAFPGGLLVAVTSLIAGARAMPRVDRPAADEPPGRLRRRDLLSRMATSMALVVILDLAGLAFGPLIGGMLAALPILASVLAASTHRRYGARTVITLLRGMLRGLPGFVGFCAVVALLIVPVGTAAAFVVAGLTAVGLQALALCGGFLWPRRDRRPPADGIQAA